MEAKAYLESGILELYATGALSLAESAEVEAMAAKHVEVAEELKRVKAAMAKYAASQEHSPRPALRSKMMEGMRNKVPGKTEQKQAPKGQASALAYKYLLAACLASLVISTFASYFFYNRWSEAEDKNIMLLGEKNALSQSYTSVKTAFDKAYSDLLIMQDMQASVYTLQPVDSAKTYGARVYWNPVSHETFLDLHFLPGLPGGKQYQLWALSGNKAVDAGVFEVNNEGGLLHMKSVFEADAWSVTVEPAGGSTMPTTGALCLKTKKQ